MKPEKPVIRVETCPESVSMQGLIGPSRIEIMVEYYGQVIAFRLSSAQALNLLERLAQWKDDF